MELAIIAVMVLLFFIGLLFGYRQHYLKVRDELGILARYKKNYLKKTGSALYNHRKIDYRLISLNGGLSWYVTDKAGEIYGNVEDIYPELMLQLDDDSQEHKRNQGKTSEKNVS